MGPQLTLEIWLKKVVRFLVRIFCLILFLTVKNKMWFGTKDGQEFRLQKIDQIRLYLVWLNDIFNPFPAPGEKSPICCDA